MRRLLLLILLSLLNLAMADIVIPCSSLNQDSDPTGYHYKLDIIMIAATRGDRGYTRYDEDLILDFCRGEGEEYAELLVSNGYIKKSQVVAVKEVLGLEKRPEGGIRQEKAREFLTGFVGLCSACAGSPAIKYAYEPESKCAQVIDSALGGDLFAVQELRTEPEYCQQSQK